MSKPVDIHTVLICIEIGVGRPYGLWVNEVKGGKGVREVGRGLIPVLDTMKSIYIEKR